MLKIRSFQPTTQDYEAAIEIWNANWSESPKTIDDEKQSDVNRNPAHFIQRLVGEDRGKVVIMGECGATHWLSEPAQYYWHLNVLPEYANQGFEEQMYDALIVQLAQRNPRQFFVGMRDDKITQIRFIEERGYRLVQTEPTSYLDVDTFEAVHFAELMNRIEQMGIQIFSVCHLQQVDPEWLLKLWNLQWEIRRDIPRAGEAIREPIEEFEKKTADPDYNANAHFVAIEQTKINKNRIGPYIGMTRLSYNRIDPTIGRTNLTGVVRSYRRQGIATALKVQAITTAKAQGVRRIDTMNHEDNPMLDLNIRLGFKIGPAWRYYEKIL